MYKLIVCYGRVPPAHTIPPGRTHFHPAGTHISPFSTHKDPFSTHRDMASGQRWRGLQRTGIYMELKGSMWNCYWIAPVYLWIRSLRGERSLSPQAISGTALCQALLHSLDERKDSPAPFLPGNLKPPVRRKELLLLRTFSDSSVRVFASVQDFLTPDRQH